MFSRCGGGHQVIVEMQGDQIFKRLKNVVTGLKRKKKKKSRVDNRTFLPLSQGILFSS